MLTEQDVQRVADAVANRALSVAKTTALDTIGLVPAMSQTELRDLVRDTCRDTIKETLRPIGIDIDDPKTAVMFQRVVSFQRAVGQIVILSASSIAAAIVCAALWALSAPWRGK